MDPTDDDVLVRQIRAGDVAALETLLRRHLPQVSAICRRICLNQADAEDATQEALIAIAKGAPGFDGRSSLRTWVHRVTTNACLDELRRIRRRPVPTDQVSERAASDQTDPGAQVEGSAVRKELRAALESMPIEFRAAVVLRDVGDLEYAEIADILEVKVGTVKSRIARGRALLADIVTPEGTKSPGGSSKEETPP